MSFLFAFCVYMLPLILFWAVFLAMKKMIPLRISTFGDQLMIVGSAMWFILSLIFSLLLTAPQG